MARDILPTPVLEGRDVVEFYNKLANFEKNLKEKGITWEGIQSVGVQRNAVASTFRFVWDGNVLLHETFKKDNSENTELTTWVFEGFVPTAKLVNGKAYSIISDHLGTPILAVDSEGNEV